MTEPTLRGTVLKGGAYLTMRQAAGTALNVVGVLLLTSTIGPRAFGVYSAAMGLFLALQLITQLGLNVYIIRQEQFSPKILHVASTLMLVLAVAGMLVGFATVPFLQSWTRINGIAPVAIAIYATLPLSNLALIPLARLERDLEYRHVAIVELISQAVFFIVALPMAFAGRGVWAPVEGWAAQQLVHLVLIHRAARYWPRFEWDRAIVRNAVEYGGGYTGSLWLYQLRRTVNPLIVGRYLGADAVGIVAVTAQIVTHLSFVTVATWRLSMAALSRVQGNAEKLRRAVSDGMRLQTLAVAPFLVVFAWLAPFAVPLLLGKEWRQIAVVYPFIALGMLAASTFNLQSAALYVLRNNRGMAVFHAVQTTLLATAALLLVPRYGLIGYGLAELVALLSYFVLHAFTVRHIGRPAYARTLALSFAFALALGVNYLGLWSLLGLALVALTMQPWRELSVVIGELRGMAYD